MEMLPEGRKMSVKQRYLKDENGEIFSPITSATSVLTNRSQSTKPIEELVPYTFSLNENSSYSTSLPIFSGSISNWTMIKFYLNARTSDITTTKAVYLRLNDTNIASGHIVDARCRDGVFTKYNNITNTKNIFLGDVAYTGHSSYIECTVICSRGNGWHSFKSSVGSVSGEADKNSLSACSGQFSLANANTQLTSVRLIAQQGIKVTGIVQIYT